jgi:hypothetical protein
MQRMDLRPQRVEEPKVEGMNENIFTGYERYILSNLNKQEGLKNLIEGSEPYEYLNSLHSLKNQIGKPGLEEIKQGDMKGITTPPPELKEADILKYVRSSKTEEAERVHLRYLFTKYDLSSSENEKKQIIQEMNEKFLKLSWNDVKPSDIQSEESKSDQSEFISDTLDPDIFNTKNYIQQLYKGELDNYAFPLVIIILMLFLNLIQGYFDSSGFHATERKRF